MKLNADLVFAGLSEDLGATMSGPREPRLKLARPEFLEPDARTLEHDRVYVARADRLPNHPDVGRGAMLVCVGESSRTRHLAERCCVVSVRATASLHAVFNQVQHVFDRYDAWEEELREALDGTCDVQRMLEVSLPIFNRTLLLIDADFRIIGSTAPEGSKAFQAVRALDGTLSIDDVAQFLGAHDLSMSVAEPFVLDILDTCTLNTNLLDGDTYRGCLVIDCSRNTYRPCDKPLAAFLAATLLKAMRHLTYMGADVGSLRQSLQDLIEGTPLGTRALDSLEAASQGSSFACVRIRVPQSAETMPLGFIRSKVSHAFERCWTFEHHRSSVIAIVDVSSTCSEEGMKAYMGDALGHILESIDARAGVSDSFRQLTEARPYFLEATEAFENGIIFQPDQRIFCFQDYALHCLLANAPGELPLELYEPAGLRRLRDHDEHSGVSYLETLHAYLRNNQGATATAKELYLHRSTLLERLRRIEGLLGCDLGDSDTCLRLRLLMRADELRSEARGTRHAHPSGTIVQTPS